GEAPVSSVCGGRQSLRLSLGPLLGRGQQGERAGRPRRLSEVRWRESGDVEDVGPASRGGRPVERGGGNLRGDQRDLPGQRRGASSSSRRSLAGAATLPGCGSRILRGGRAPAARQSWCPVRPGKGAFRGAPVREGRAASARRARGGAWVPARAT